MTITELKNWMREQLEQGNSIAVVTAGQGGSGYALADDEAIIADVDNYDDNEISIVENDDELEVLKAELAGNDDLYNYDAVVELRNDEGNILYIMYWTDEDPSDITLTKGNHQGDNLTGEGEGDDEQIMVDLANLPSKYERIVILVSIYKATDRGQHFGMIRNAFIRLVDADKNKELCIYNLSENYAGMTALVFVQCRRSAPAGMVHRPAGREIRTSALGLEEIIHSFIITNGGNSLWQ